jgi:ribosomal protein L16/L10AE
VEDELAVAFWDYGLKATTSGYISNKQIESARKVIVRHLSRKLVKFGLEYFLMFHLRRSD